MASLVMLVASALVLVGAHEQQAAQVSRILDYASYLERFHKTDAEGGSVVLARARLFIARTLQMFKHNVHYASMQVGHYLRQNAFTDMTLRETVRYFVSRNNGLRPVSGALTNPDMPAEEFMLRKLNQSRAENVLSGGKFEDEDGDQINDGYSLSVLPTQVAEPRAGPGHRHNLTGPDFLHEMADGGDELASLDELMRYFKLEPGAAKRVLRLLDGDDKTAESKMIAGHMRRLEANKRSRGILQAPLVASINEKFDPSVLPSQGFLSSARDYFTGGAFAPDDHQDVKASEDASEEGDSMLYSVMDKLIEFFAENYSDDDEDDDEDDDDEDEQKQRQEHECDTSEQFGSNNCPGKIHFDIDWRQTGCISRPKHQIKCNSCYAFATLDLMEFFHCQQKRTQTEFSAQYIIDCGRKTNLTGCRGGKVTNVGLFIREYGLQLNSIYPYSGLEQQCPFDEASDREQRSFAIRPKITGWRVFLDLAAWYNWLPKTPMIVGINMPSDFLAYGGGVHEGSDCVIGMSHAMLLVGSGKQDGKPFWLLKNSFSQDWGEEGYFRLSKRAPLRCFNSALVARANFADDANH